MRLNNKIKFIREEKVQDSTGGFDVSEIVELETWASIEQLQVSKNIEQAMQTLPKVFRVIIRDRSDFFPRVDNIIEWRGERFIIVNSPELDLVNRTRYIKFDMK